MVRFKNRYLLCYLFAPNQNLTERQLVELLRAEVQESFGYLGLARIYFSFQVKYWNPYTNLMILRVPRDHVTMLRTTLVMMKNIQDSLIKVKVLHCSGTIRKTEKMAVSMLKKWINSHIISGQLHEVAVAEKKYGQILAGLNKIQS